MGNMIIKLIKLLSCCKCKFKSDCCNKEGLAHMEFENRQDTEYDIECNKCCIFHKSSINPS
jgi:hypothetical protein